MATNALPILLAAGAAFLLFRKSGDEAASETESDYVDGTLSTGRSETSTRKYRWWVGELKDGSGWKWLAHQYDAQGKPLDKDEGVLGDEPLAQLAAKRMVAEWKFTEALDQSLGGITPEYVSTPIMDTEKHGDYTYVWTIGELKDPPGKWRFVVEQWQWPELVQRADSMALAGILAPSSETSAKAAADTMVKQWITEAAAP